MLLSQTFVSDNESKWDLPRVRPADGHSQLPVIHPSIPSLPFLSQLP